MTSAAAVGGITFFHAPGSRSTMVLWLLEELGRPCTRRVLNLHKGEHKTPAFLAVNPLGKVPAILHRVGDEEVAVTETGAICAYLADVALEAGLAPPLGDPRRGPYLKWLFFYPGVLEPLLGDRLMRREPGPPQQMGYGRPDETLELLAAAVTPGPWLLGDMFSAADVMIGSGLAYGRRFGVLPEHPALDAYVGRIDARPAFQRAMATDEALARELSAGAS